MALADTARLIASLELQDKFTGPANKAEGSLDRLEGKTRTLGRVGAETSRGLGNLGRNLAIGAAAGVGVIAASVAVGIQSLVRLEEVQTATNAVIESTGGIANITADKVRELAEEYEGLNATIDDKVIQSAENLLLTFTNIGEKAFEPALEAALNLNQALGGGEEGLQGNLILVAKALNDPIRGMGQLRRAGVQLSTQQQARVKELVEQNDLYGAQQIILEELTTQFGGQFAAAGDTAAGKFAKLKDVIEDTQMSLATAFLPVLEKAADKLGTFLADEDVQRNIGEFGETLAAGFDDLISFAGKLPWEAIGKSFELAGKGAQAVLSAFSALPPWVQTAVLTSWGLNKLTGGALGNIVGELGKGLIKGVLNMNAGVVNVNGKVVNGPGGVPGTGGGGGFLGSLLNGLKTGAALASPVLAGTAAVMTVDFVGNAQKAANKINDQLADLPRNTADELDVSIAKVDGAIQVATDGPLATIVSNSTGLKQRLDAELHELQRQKQIIAAASVAAQQSDRTMIATASRQLSIASEQRRVASEALSADRVMLGTASMQLQEARNNTGVLRAKNFSPTINNHVSVNAVSNVTISEIQRRITSSNIALGISSINGFVPT